MSIWIYKNRELLHNESISYREIYSLYKISQTTIHRYKNTKLYKDIYFSNHRLNEDELDMIFINSKHTKIDNNNNTQSNINEQLLKAINELKEQVIESQKKSDIQYKCNPKQKLR